MKYVDVDIEDMADDSRDGYDRRRSRRKARKHADMFMQMEAGCEDLMKSWRAAYHSTYRVIQYQAQAW